MSKADNPITSKLPPMAAGQRYGRLTAVAFVRMGKNSQAIWTFMCDCGNEHVAMASSVRRSDTKSCGCLKIECCIATGKATSTHRMYGSIEYNSWKSLIQRCTNADDPRYPGYGGRGITVCERWRLFENFYFDMGKKPSPQHSIDRIDNDKGYGPENCRWATRSEQGRNKRGNRFVVVDGVSITLAEAAEKSGLNYNIIRKRIRLGWDIDRALSTPARRYCATEL